MDPRLNDKEATRKAHQLGLGVFMETLLLAYHVSDNPITVETARQRVLLIYTEADWVEKTVSVREALKGTITLLMHGLIRPHLRRNGYRPSLRFSITDLGRRTLQAKRVINEIIFQPKEYNTHPQSSPA